MAKNLNRLTLVLLVSFAVVALSLTYWAVFASDSMLARDDNPRRVEAERAIRRGAIYDRSGEVLARSVETGRTPSGGALMRRDYPHPEAASAIGYYSLIHGVGGVEAAFDRTLRGTERRDAGKDFLDALLHRAQVGSDLRVTLDLNLQKKIASAFGTRHGAAVVIDVPTGAVLAMVSAPSFDPNRLNDTWDTLRKDPVAPLVNRVTQGIYQPGGALQTVILAASLAEKIPTDETAPDAAAPLQVNGLTLTCVVPSPVTTLRFAYANACPTLFAQAVRGRPGAAKIQAMFEAFGLLQPPMLVSFETVAGKAPTPLTMIADPARLDAQGTGQDDLTVTPLQMVLVAATIANRGNRLTPYMVEAIRPPDSNTWESIPLISAQAAVITPEVAEAIRAMMLDAVDVGGAQAARTPGSPLKIYGHASLAYTGPQQNANAWFIGFVDLPDSRSIAVAVIVEAGADTPTAAAIGGSALSEASRISAGTKP